MQKRFVVVKQHRCSQWNLQSLTFQIQSYFTVSSVSKHFEHVCDEKVEIWGIVSNLVLFHSCKRFGALWASLWWKSGKLRHCFKFSLISLLQAFWKHFEHLCDETSDFNIVPNLVISLLQAFWSTLESSLWWKSGNLRHCFKFSLISLWQAFWSTLSIFVMKKWKSEALFQI